LNVYSFLPCRSPLFQGRHLLDGLLLVLLGAAAFLLGCYEMGDSDVWWHLRGGQWILENGRVPQHDPFTFGSADRLWVDLHWSYEVILALAYRLGGVGALVWLGASVGGAAFLAALTTRRRAWPVPVVVLCWLPALVLLSYRLDPRPEIFTLLYLGCYLAVLGRADEQPSLLWLLPLVQVLWTNVQGLFILGPIVLVLFVTARAAGLLWRRLRGETAWTAEDKRRWQRLGIVTLAVAAACLVNPYFLKGAWFPFELFPKVADPNNPYKRYIDELKSPGEVARRDTVAVVGKDWFFLALYLLLPLLALSFLYPALWRARQPKSRGAWLGGLIAVIALLVLRMLTLSGKTPSWLNAAGDNVPLLVAASGGIAAFVWSKRCPWAAATALVCGIALAVCMIWLDVHVLGAGRGLLADLRSRPRTQVGFDASDSTNVGLALTGGLAALFVLRWGGDLFRMLLTGAFAILALQALQNEGRFALVAGTVLTWNFAEWAAQLEEMPALRPRRILAWSVRILLLLVLGAWIIALVGDRYYVHTGLARHFAFREEPLAFAHDAAVFAGQPGLPDRALVYGLAQTGVYDFHNAPRCKPFMDGRLEMPAQRTFQTYLAIEDWLEKQDPRWEKAVADLGDPLLLQGHADTSGSAEASLLLHPNWRCVYFDALAAAFVPRSRVAEAEYPSVDFAARHFREPGRPSVPDAPRAAAREEKALTKLAGFVPRTPEYAWRWRIPLLLNALDRADLALREDPNQPDTWIVLANCHRDLNPDLAAAPHLPVEEWNVERGLWPAQTTYCLRRAIALQPDNGTAWRYLAMSYAQRRMFDAQLSASEQWLNLDTKVSDEQRQQVKSMRRRFNARPPEEPRGEPLPSAVLRLVSEGRPLRAVPRLEASERSSWSWLFAERVAGLYLHLGRPADARRVWQQARDCPSEAVRHCRLACTFWVERDFASALRHYAEARNTDAKLAEPCWGLAMLHAQLGDAELALSACRQGLGLTLTSRQRSDLEALQRFLRSYAERP
jgi:hypothetical protein